MRWLVVLVALAGCDELFSVDFVELHPDGDVVAVDATADALSDACPTIFGYAPVAGTAPRSTYRYVPSNGAAWDGAELDCETDSPNKITHLVVFDDPSEEAALRSLVPASPQFWQVFTGYARNANSSGGASKMFTSVLGEPLAESSPLWEKVSGGAEPDDGGTTLMEETITFFEMTRNMSDGRASSQLAYICECDGKVANQTFNIR
jgi:hypothetical protein